MSAFGQLLRLASAAGGLRAGKVVIGLARMHWRYFAIGRGRGLAKMLPLVTPMKIHVDPASGCNFKCFFCPQSNPEALKAAGVQAGVMKLALFQKLIDDLKDFPQRIDELVLGNYGEPLLNKNLPEMIKYAVSSGQIREVSVITNADLLSEERGDKIAAAGLHKIRISVEALSDKGYLDTVDVAVSFAKIVNNISKFRAAVKKYGYGTFIYIKIIDIGMSDQDKREFFRIFTPLADAVAIENLMPVTEKAIQFVGVTPKGMTGVSLSKGRSVCPSPFYSLSIHMDGDVGVCCSDWHHKTNVGSVKDMSIKEIWNGQDMQKFRINQLTNSWRSLDACKGCEMVNHYPEQEDLDHHRAELLKVDQWSVSAQ